MLDAVGRPAKVTTSESASAGCKTRVQHVVADEGRRRRRFSRAARTRRVRLLLSSSRRHDHDERLRVGRWRRLRTIARGDRCEGAGGGRGERVQPSVYRTSTRRLRWAGTRCSANRTRADRGTSAHAAPRRGRGASPPNRAEGAVPAVRAGNSAFAGLRNVRKTMSQIG